ncbi:orotate phosphoribosyltransferase [Candidatus Bathyarchaeota archaeon]|nr:orotate phosphoribosyltransferase [Candidatus Bathyarchaeota archaeon]
MNSESAKKQLCQILFEIGALKFGAFRLTSGKASPYYIDLRMVPSFPDAFHRICDIYVKLIEDNVGAENFRLVAGVPTAGIPFGAVLAYNLHRPFIYIRSTQSNHGRKRRVEGVLTPGDKVLLLDDLVTSGKSLIQAASAIRTEGGIVNDAVVLITREEGGEEKIAKENLTLHYLLKAGEIANMMREGGVIDEEELKKILRQRTEG